MRLWWDLVTGLDYYKAQSIMMLKVTMITFLFSWLIAFATKEILFSVIPFVIPLTYTYAYWTTVRKHYLETVEELAREEYLLSNYGYHYNKIVNDDEF